MPKFPDTYKNHMGSVKLIRELLLFRTAEPIDPADLDEVLKESQTGLNIFNPYPQQTSLHWQEVNQTPRYFWVRSPAKDLTSDNTQEQILGALGDRLEWLSPVYAFGTPDNPRNLFAPAANRLIVGRKPGLEDSQIGTAAELGLVLNEILTGYTKSFLFFDLKEPKKNNIFEIREKLLSIKDLFDVIYFNNAPLVRPYALIPSDTYFTDQWNLTRINAPLAWDITMGVDTVKIAILDDGCEYTHPELQPKFLSQNVNLEVASDPTAPPFLTTPRGRHGTPCAGIAASRLDNGNGISGLAGECKILPMCFDFYDDDEFLVALNYIIAQGVHVASMSLEWNWNAHVLDEKLEEAIINHNIVFCAATGNDENAAMLYPATHPLVIACGASNKSDRRCTVGDPMTCSWSSNFGDGTYLSSGTGYISPYSGTVSGVSVVAPGIEIPSTDRLGPTGYTDASDPLVNPDYVLAWDGTSSATPLVAGLAALIKSEYPALTSLQIRAIIERTAEKIGPTPYTLMSGFPNGTRNEQMGYGRINAYRALDLADVYIKDWPGDDGTEPSTPPNGNYWASSDIVVRANDDGVFLPADPLESARVEKGQTNYIYVRVSNRGPAEARNVRIKVRVVAYVGTAFSYPADWQAVDATHVVPTVITDTFTTLQAGATVDAKFSLSAAQVDTLFNWNKDQGWHPCILAEVDATNDYAFDDADTATPNVLLRRNNFAQRNVSVIDAIPSPSATRTFAFVTGQNAGAPDVIRLVIEKDNFSSETPTYLRINQNEALLPQINFEQLNQDMRKADEKIEFLEDSSMKLQIGSRTGIVRFAKGSFIQYLNPPGELQVQHLKGGQLIPASEKKLIELRGQKVTIDLKTEPGMRYPLAIETRFAGTKPGELIRLSIRTEDLNGNVLGGADVVYRMFGPPSIGS